MSTPGPGTTRTKHRDNTALHFNTLSEQTMKACYKCLPLFIMHVACILSKLSVSSFRCLFLMADNLYKSLYYFRMLRNGMCGSPKPTNDGCPCFGHSFETKVCEQEV
ncbi:unnamed protein product [Wuchereria bancrofti]|uniref:Uncharacterized protein n=1 Tax=Wuchereria bancrofti TaxID=6293 RepID=A0A3P7EB00_WUCBA|nr:unnamed protein product [Wuchereria bancrofti]